ncbi:MAG: ferritin family protein [Methanobacteriota archaeon]|nr:MAG: ferritin family protein [Euryarchaeota archaeon]
MARIGDIIATAIEFELFGKEYYMRFHELVGDAKAKALMKGLAHDEEEHAAMLAKELEAHGGAFDYAATDIINEGLEKIFPHRILKDSIKTKDAISTIKLGIETEQRSIDFYSGHAKEADPKLREVFAKLEKMERTHLELLKENLLHLQEGGVWYGYVPILEG